ncbi:unnamed protein product [Protopolystoma xenopodis]|uniref:Uncharacterized protein n=1 Tax=Protopolystoma xenopodis TaxID=117903 RepID=A0A448XKL5_9PLAT|nr:unnamed protein product [Protopolystoma xenopodis]
MAHILYVWVDHECIVLSGRPKDGRSKQAANHNRTRFLLCLFSVIILISVASSALPTACIRVGSWRLQGAPLSLRTSLHVSICPP